MAKANGFGQFGAMLSRFRHGAISVLLLVGCASSSGDDEQGATVTTPSQTGPSAVAPDTANVPLGAGGEGPSSPASMAPLPASTSPQPEAVGPLPTPSATATAVAPGAGGALAPSEPAGGAAPTETMPTAGGSGGDPATAGGAAGAAAGGTPSAGTGGTGGGNTAGSGSREPVFHVFLLLGQSNMAGYPKAQPEDREEDPRITVLGFDDCAQTGRVTDEWDVAAPPLHECWNDGLGPGDYFAKTLIELVPEGDTIGLVPCAISGERIETFMKDGGSRYEWILGRARMAQELGGVIEGLLFHQGESNSGDSSWPGKVNTFVTDLRSDLGIGEVPFLAGELLYSGGTSGHNTLVNQLPDVVDNAHVVSAEGLVVDPSDTEWNLHFSRDSVVTFGERYADTMVQALGW